MASDVVAYVLCHLLVRSSTAKNSVCPIQLARHVVSRLARCPGPASKATPLNAHSTSTRPFARVKEEPGLARRQRWPIHRYEDLQYVGYFGAPPLQDR